MKKNYSIPTSEYVRVRTSLICGSTLKPDPSNKGDKDPDGNIIAEVRPRRTSASLLDL